MNATRFTLPLLLLSGLLSACAEPPTGQSRNVAPGFDFSNGPSPVGGDNVAVYRFQGYWFWFWTDAPLRAWHTSFPLSAGCGPTDLLEAWSMQDVVSFQDFLRVHRVAAADVHIMIVDQTQPGDCLGGTLLADGMGSIHQTDNDYFAFDPFLRGDRNNANAFGFSAQGELRRPDGTAARYSGHWRAVWNPADASFGTTSMQVTLH
jgi:hypothetical protein